MLGSSAMSAAVVPLSSKQGELPSDPELVARGLRGERWALSLLYRRHSPSIR
jgi:hypothetical protein